MSFTPLTPPYLPFGINGIEVISFCEFNHKTTEVTTVEELCKVARYGKTMSEMWESLTEKDIWLF